MHEYLVSMSYFSALSIVCVVLYAFTYFLPTPENQNKARSTFYFRLVLLFTIASFEVLLLRYDYFPLAAMITNNLLFLLMIYSLMFAVYTRYDHDITSRYYIYSAIHCIVFIVLMYFIQTHSTLGYLRAIVTLVNVSIPYSFTLIKCHQQFKKHRIGDRILYGALLTILLILSIYVFIYSFVFTGESKTPLLLYFIASLSFVCILFFGFALSIIYSLIGKLRKELITDRLTGAKNRNYFNDISQQLISMAKRTNTPLSLIVCDIDWFKKINDTYGHAAGDKVLVNFSSNIKQALRLEDVFIRIGGEEFIIILPQINLEKALLTAERLRSSTDLLPINVGVKSINITASFGVTEVDLQQSIDHSVNNADGALYEAKRSGRNKVVAFTS